LALRIGLQVRELPLEHLLVRDLIAEQFSAFLSQQKVAKLLLRLVDRCETMPRCIHTRIGRRCEPWSPPTTPPLILMNILLLRVPAWLWVLRPSRVL